MKINIVIVVALACAIHFVLTSCEDNSPVIERPVTKSGINSKTIERPIGGLKDHPNDQGVPYPEITHQTYISDNPLWAHTRCQAWRIEWPHYDGAVNPDRIPSVFTLHSGALNSFYFLNNTSPATTYKTNFSLYYEDKIEHTISMWMQLPHATWAVHEMETTYFSKAEIALDTIQHMVTQRASLFETYWPEGTQTTAFDYQAGDFFLFKNSTQGRFGGVRIVSMSPRIIEVYLAEPNI